jgi:hypothetical protein
MRLRLCGVVIVCVALAASACGQHAPDSAAAATARPAAERAPAPAADAPAMGGMAHGDHNPHHGGVVYMYHEVHYEVVLEPDGRHRLYFTDSAREDLPASVASSVTLTVERPGASAETLHGVIDESGESWLLTGQPVAGTTASVRVAFIVKGSEYWIDVPFIPATQ